MKVLRKGAVGDSVKILQEILGLKNDGVYGPLTEKAVKEWQIENGLLSDGVIGPITWQLLLGKSKLTRPHALAPFKPAVNFVIDPEIEKLEDPEIMGELETIEEAETCENIIKLIELFSSWVPTRLITTLFLHCTATNQNASVSAIQKYWRETLGWRNPGYHIIIKKDGSFTYLHNLNSISNGVAGHNSISINVAYIGGIDRNGKAIDNRTIEQIMTMDLIVKLAQEKINNIIIRGHNEVSSKECPSFNVKKYYNLL
jgi:N-acetylmuramoyl-L-alanine amidase